MTATFLFGPALRRLRLHPSFLEGAVDDRAFDRLDGDRRVLDVERAGRLARRGADPAGEFRKVVGREQIARRLLPIAAIGEIVPVGDLVVDRTADVTIGDAAIHAARRLIARRLLAQGQHEFAIMADSVGGRRIAPVRAIDLQKSRDLAHPVTPEPAAAPDCAGRAPTRSIRRRLYLARTLPARRPAICKAEAVSGGPACVILPRPASAARSAPRVQPARGDIRPASPCGISADRPPTPPGCAARGSSRYSARG